MMAALADLPDYKTANGLTDPEQFLLVADLNGDNRLTNADLQSLLNLIKSGNGQADSVPEPSCVVLAALGFLGLAIAGANSRRIH